MEELDISQVKELMTAVSRKGLKGLSWEVEGKFKLHIEGPEEAKEVVVPVHAPYVGQSHAEHAAHLSQVLSANPSTSIPKHQLEAAPQAAESAPAEPSGQLVTSPMVGTFYNSPSPDEPSFVKEGDQVTPDTVMCIVEAMKVMNEVKAGVSGTVKRVFVSDGDAVQFGTELFEIS